MTHTKTIRGRSVQGETPNWEPLLDLTPDHIGDFMWMFEVKLADGTPLHAYKHYWTRRYIHLTCDGRAFVWCGDERYEEADPCKILDLVLP
jgi:hypothetical protein